MSDPRRQRARLPLAKLIANEDGITAIEYGLVAALISVFIMVAIGAVGDTVVAIFEQVENAVPG
jgi:pilus assembly protein Flp/PilA